MEPNITPCSKIVAISGHKRISPEQILEPITSKHGRPKNPQEMGKARAGSRKNCLNLLLTSLLLIGIWAVPGFALEACDESCTPCHGNSEAVHGNFNHSAAPGSGPVVIFADTVHSNAGWVGASPYFDVTVNCAICHNTDLPTIHGNDCATCHPTPYETLGIWGKGCQQGGCHPFYHEDSTRAHLPFENPIQSVENTCNRCHDPSWAVPQSKCLNCHATYEPGDVTPPITTSNTQTVYDGSAKIDFSITDNSKVGVGRTFYQLDGGPVIAAGKNLLITTPGSHGLEFWSTDQSGNTESGRNTVTFTILADTTPPTTTSNAKTTHNQGELITLTATDTSTQGVKTTYYRFNSGPIQTGNRVVVPATSGSNVYTLAFWSEDWSGNIEIEKSVNFTVTGGTGTLRLVWSNSDTSGSPCLGDPDAEATWTIGRVGSNTVVAAGAGGCPNWSGNDNVTVPLSLTPYYIIINWWDSYYEDWDQTAFSSVFVTTPGQVIRLSY